MRLAKAGMFLAVLAFVLGGCGGGEDGSSTNHSSGDPAAGVSKAQYIAQAEAICKKMDKEYLAAYQDFAKANDIERYPSAEQGYEISEDLYIPMMERRLAALAALTAPSGDEKQAEAILTAMKRGIAAANKNIKEVTEGGSDIFGESKSLSKAYGLKTCGL